MELEVRIAIRKLETKGMCKNKMGNKQKTKNIVIKIRILVMHDIWQRTNLIDKNDRVRTQTRIKYTHEAIV